MPARVIAGPLVRQLANGYPVIADEYRAAHRRRAHREL
jgi:hypothetical protein